MGSGRFATLVVIAASIFVLGIGGVAHADTVTVYPDGVHRINGTYTSLHSSGIFSTLAYDPDRTLLRTNTSTFLTALAALGPGPYVINSAELVVGVPADNYAVTIPAYLMQRDWDPADVTWADPDPNDSVTALPWGAPGTQGGVDYSALQVTSGTINDGSTTTFQGLGPTVQSWLAAPSANFGLFFPTSGFGNEDYTGAGYVDPNAHWVIDANLVTAVPLPNAALAGLVLVSGLGLTRKLSFRRRLDPSA